ncbi:MAG: hypothetical protein AAFO07_19645, partial [Bacteroidota bacterium]
VSNVNAQSPMAGMSPPEFKAEKAAGITTYDYDEVIKKLKVKEKERKTNVSEALKIYNSQMDDLAFNHSSTFQSLEAEFNSNLQIAMQNRDRSQMNGVRAKIQEIIPPIRKEAIAEKEKLNTVMKEILTEKQNEKWLKYQNRMN